LKLEPVSRLSKQIALAGMQIADAKLEEIEV
jgi:hypothetical protein